MLDAPGHAPGAVLQAVSYTHLDVYKRQMDFRGVRFCEVRDGERLPSFDLSAIWPARSVPTLADLFANLDLGGH